LSIIIILDQGWWWIGAVKDGSTWRWTTGESMVYKRWRSGHPTSSGQFTHLRFYNGGYFTWIDGDTPNGRAFFICES